MDKNDRVHQILAHLASAASVAADGVSGAVQNAGKSVSNKYDIVKLNIEINRLQDDQKKLFADIGRTMFLIKSDVLEGEGEDSPVAEAQKTIDNLLLIADQKQKDIDALSDRLSRLNGSRVCGICGKVASVDDMYCSACGAKMPDPPHDEAAVDEPGDEPGNEPGDD